MSKVYEYLKDRLEEDGPQHPSECVKTKRVKPVNKCNNKNKELENDKN
jgi:hypothetical protein